MKLTIDLEPDQSTAVEVRVAFDAAEFARAYGMLSIQERIAVVAGLGLDREARAMFPPSPARAAVAVALLASRLDDSEVYVVNLAFTDPKTAA